MTRSDWSRPDQDAAGLAAFRIYFYAIIAWEVWRYFEHDRVDRYYQQPGFHFKYYGFGWVEALPENGMTWVFLALGAAAVAAGLGLLYRVTAPVVAALLAYVFLLDQTRYLNHFYLMVILAGLLAVMPANRFLALDARLGLVGARSAVGAWTYRVLRAQLVLVYVFAGIAKLNADWLAGEPIGAWLVARSDVSRGDIPDRAVLRTPLGWAFLRLGRPGGGFSGSGLAAVPAHPVGGGRGVGLVPPAQLADLQYRGVPVADARGDDDLLRPRLAAAGVPASRG